MHQTPSVEQASHGRWTMPMHRSPHVLIVEDDARQCETLRDILTLEGMSVRACGTASQAMAVLATEPIAVAIVDHKLPDASGTQLLDYIRTRHPLVRVIIHTGYGSFESAKDAVNLGAFAYVEKLNAPEELISTVHRAMEQYMAHALEESQGRLRSITENVLDFIVQLDREGRVIFINRQVPGITDRPNPTAYDFVPPDMHEQVRQVLEEVFRTGQPQQLEIRNVGEDGQPNWYDTRVGPVVIDGRVTSVVVIAHDVSARKSAEHALRESQRMIATLMSNLPGMAYRCLDDADYTFEFASEGCMALTGYPVSAFVSRQVKFASLIHPDDRERVARGVREAVDAGRAFELFYRIRTAQGQERWVWEQGRGVQDETGRVVALEGFISDVTDRRRAEQALAARMRQQAVVSELGQRALGGTPLAQLMDEAVRLVAQTLDVELANVLELLPRGDRFRLIAGFGWKDGVVGELILPNNRDSQAGYAVLSREPVIVEDWRDEKRFNLHQMLREHGVHSGVSVVIEGNERPFGVLSAHAQARRAFTKDDISFMQSVANVLAVAVQQTRTATALRESEMHYRQAAESNRRLLHEVNHRVRNNLAGLMSLLSLTRQRATSVEEFAAAMESRIQAMTRTHNLLADVGWRPLELRALINSLLGYTMEVAPYAIEVVVDGPSVPITPRQSVPLAMSLIELFTNSCKHGAHRSPEGRLHISWETVMRDDTPWVHLRWRETGGPPIQTPIRPSLGTELIHGFVNFELGGQVTLRFPPTGADHVLEFAIEALPSR